MIIGSTATKSLKKAEKFRGTLSLTKFLCGGLQNKIASSLGPRKVTWETAMNSDQQPHFIELDRAGTFNHDFERNFIYDSALLQGQSPLARLVKRMTRFFLSCGVKEAVETLKVILEPMHMNISRTSPGSVSTSKGWHELVVQTAVSEIVAHKVVSSGDNNPTIPLF